MNISQMMRSFLGEGSAADSRAMELRVGQIVRGVILQVMDNNEALVQINGVQVQAKLELPLQAGQTAILQVTPDSNGSLVMLKQVDPGAVGLPEDTFKEWAKQLSLPEQRWAVDIVKDLRREGVILNRDVAQAFQQAAAAMPQGANAEEWMQAAAAAFKRGLPMTGTVVSALQQVMFGRSTHELLNVLQQQLSSLMTEADAGAEQKPLAQAAARVQMLLTEGAALLRSAAAAADMPQQALATGRQEGAGAAVQQAAAASRPDGLQMGSSSTAAAASMAADAADSALPAAGRAAVTAASPNWLSQMMKWLGVDHEMQLTRTVAAESQPASQAQAAQQQTGMGGERQAGADAARQAPAASPASAASALPAASQPGASQAGLNNAGAAPVTGESGQLTEQARMQDARQPAAAASQMPGPVIEGGRAAESVQTIQQESLKSALLSLAAADDIPAAVKETAQQLIQQITGQQLLLSPERNSSMLTHVTMFIPLKSEDGSQTASVHIQTRRGRKGELDASNCRLLFNLSMNTLGDTMVDVNVTDKIVSLNLWNDHPAIGMLAESARADVASSLQEVGYQLLSLRTTPLPKAHESGGEAAAAAASAAAKKLQQPPDLSEFSSTRYKGVDFRI